MTGSGITLAFSGVNQIYQLALAAQEIGRLDAFYCSLLDAPGKWGTALARLLGADTLTNRRALDLDPRRVHEIPGPFVAQRLAAAARLTEGRFHWSRFNFRFDAARGGTVDARAKPPVRGRGNVRARYIARRA